MLITTAATTADRVGAVGRGLVRAHDRESDVPAGGLGLGVDLATSGGSARRHVADGLVVVHLQGAIEVCRKREQKEVISRMK